MLTIGILIAGVLGFVKLPVSPLPQVDFPVIMVQAQLPGASPDTVATSVAEPLGASPWADRRCDEMTSASSLGQTRIILQFDLNRNIDGAARDVQAAINAARADLPAALRSNPIYRKLNPSDAPILILALSFEDSLARPALRCRQQCLPATAVAAPRYWPGDDRRLGSARRPRRIKPDSAVQLWRRPEDIRAALASANANSPKGAIEDNGVHYQVYTNDQASQSGRLPTLIVGYRNGNPVHLSDLGEILDSVEDLRNEGLANGEPAVLVIIFRQPGANIIDAVDRVKAELPHS